MSQTPPPNPYGQPAGRPPNPYGQSSGQPPNPYGQQPGVPPGQPPHGPGGPSSGEPWRPPRRGRSNVAKFWIGVALCIPVLLAAGALQAVPSVIADAVSLPPEVGQFSTLGLDLALFGAFIAGLVVEKTRFIVLGILAGIAILFVVAAGACVLLLAGMMSGY